MHVLPEASIPFPLPIDAFLKNQVSNDRKIERRNIKSVGNLSSEYQDRLQRELAAKSQGLLVLPEFGFHHVLYQLTEAVLSAEGLMYGFTKCATFLKLRDNADLGLTVLISPKWIMLALTKDAYVRTADSTEVYLDGFAFAGLMQL